MSGFSVNFWTVNNPRKTASIEFNLARQSFRPLIPNEIEVGSFQSVQAPLERLFRSQAKVFIEEDQVGNKTKKARFFGQGINATVIDTGRSIKLIYWHPSNLPN